ncbi:coiled-coil domain-containing protein 177-like isoform X2 [Patiria miniata]|uniref:Coiled-coil domain-containing protein 177-like n=1 Tax=Patiria miniata TaxID=46514 RepID=A0A914BL57_PATMI|nr:coiled-coil domain-containing protein 177-like isoform X2 [Patiria miniata]XP_038076516.1 coiled-coil domain-containing protein 177-like isoform X2 [Patiria miniata]
MNSASKSRTAANMDNSSSMSDWQNSSYNLHLDLFNFESVEAVDSPYILTSPRSLEACTQLEVQPIELLHKDLMEFEEECLLTGQPLSNAKRLYEEHEEQRLRKLKQCRRLRERLILEQEEDENSRHKSRHHSKGTESPKRDHEYSIKNRSLEFGQGDNRNTVTDKPQRPASAHFTSQRSQKSNRPSTAPSSEPRRTTRSITHHTPASPIVTTPGLRSKVRGPQERSMSSCSSRQSVSRLSSASGASVLSDQDQKILDLLEKKYKDEKMVEEMRQEMRLAWDEQRRTEERSKVRNEMQRRKNLAEANQSRQKKKEREQRQKQLKRDKEMKEAEEDVQYRDLHHARLVKEQEALMQHQIQLKKLEDAEKKNKQERVLKKREQKDEEYRQAVSDHLAVTQERAERLRSLKEDQEAREYKERNWKGTLLRSSMKASLEKDNQEYMTSLRESILLKQSRAERNLGNRQWLQEHEIKLNRQKEESLQEKSRQLRQEIEDENRQWQRQLMYESLMAQERAAQQANETVQSKANKARYARRSRELTHKELKKRVDEDEALYQESIKMDLAYKDMKSQSLAAQKQDVIQRSRVVAMESAKLRDQIRQQYLGSFDKMAQRAQHQSSLGRGPQMSTKNYTTFTMT